MFPIENKRVRWITREQAERLLSILPLHQAAMARFSRATGLRQGTVCRLEWSQVDMQRHVAWIHPDQSKNRRALGVALNSEARDVLLEQVGKHKRYVFTYNGKPVKQVNTKSWKKAVKQAGLDDFRWHDLRHTWASWLAQAGTPLYVIQEADGWQSQTMVQRYAHLSAEHLLAHVERIAAPNLHRHRFGPVLAAKQ